MDFQLVLENYKKEQKFLELWLDNIPYKEYEIPSEVIYAVKERVENIKGKIRLVQEMLLYGSDI